MPTRQLMLTQIKCDDDTGESGDDSPYVVVFMAHRNVSGGKLISGGFLQVLMQNIWNIYGGSGSSWSNLTGDQLRAIVRPKLTDLLKSSLSNDEYLGAHSFVVPLVTTETALSPLNYGGDGGSYKVTFTVRIKGG